jgi:hypothetical protein
MAHIDNNYQQSIKCWFCTVGILKSHNKLHWQVSANKQNFNFAQNGHIGL